MSGYLGRIIAAAAALGVTLALAGPSVAAPPSGPGRTPGHLAGPPTVSSLYPTHGPADTLVTVAGTGFPESTHVLVDGTQVPTFYGGPTKVSFKISDSLSSGAHSVTVEGAAGRVSGLKFLVHPKIMQIISWHDKPGALFTIKGTAFIKTSKVVWKSADNKGIRTLDVTYVSASELQCKVPSNAVPGPYLVGVDNGGGLASNLSNFLVVKP